MKMTAKVRTAVLAAGILGAAAFAGGTDSAMAQMHGGWHGGSGHVSSWHGGARMGGWHGGARIGGWHGTWRGGANHRGWSGRWWHGRWYPRWGWRGGVGVGFYGAYPYSDYPYYYGDYGYSAYRSYYGNGYA